MENHNGIVVETPMSVLRRIRETTTRLLHEQDAAIAALRAKLIMANADAERLAEALGLLAIATGREDCGGKVAHALAAHEARKGGA